MKLKKKRELLKMFALNDQKRATFDRAQDELFTIQQ